MDVWIETVAGTLVMASCMTHISMRKAGDGSWDVSVSASAAPAAVATGLADESAARRIRNGLAMAHHTAKQADQPQVLVYNVDAARVCAYALDA